MMKCPHCAAEIADGLSACPKCNENLLAHRGPHGAPPPKGPEPRPSPADGAPPPFVPPPPPDTVSCPFCREPISRMAAACPWCKSDLLGGHGVAGPPRPNVPWEDKSLNVFVRWWKTWAGTQFGFDNFWSRVPWSGGHAAPLKFVAFWNLQLLIPMLLCGGPYLAFMMMAVASNPRAGPEPAVATGVIIVCAVLFIPVWFALATYGVYVAAGIYHLFLLMVGGQKGFEATFRAVCYTVGSDLWAFAPVPGLQIVAQVVSRTFAFAHAHQITKGRACVAALLPPLLCCSAIAVSYVAFAAVVIAALPRR